MNYFTQELQRILCNCTAAEQVSYAGRSAYVRMDQDLRARIEFASMHISGHYDAIRASILNRVDGKVDIAVFHFSDLLGYKKTSNPNFSRESSRISGMTAESLTGMSTGLPAPTTS